MSDAENSEKVNPLDELQLPKESYKRATAARKLHETYETLQEQYKQERIALEKKFLAEKEKLYAERQAILSGEKEVPEVEGKFSDEESDEKGVPQFWLTVLTSHPTIGSLVTEEDVPALNALTNVTCKYGEDFKSFTLAFEFQENDFFTNKVLTKTYHVSPDLLDEKSPQLENVETTVIDWKPSKNLCVTEIKKKQKAKSGRNKGQVRTVTRTEPKPSFFHYFDEQSEDQEEDEEEEDKDEDEEGATKLSLDEDYDVAHIIRTTMIPEAIVWFTGEAVEDMDFLYGDEDDEDDDEEGDEEDDEDDEEGGSDKPKLKFDSKAGFAAAGGAAGGAAGEKPECKQN